MNSLNVDGVSPTVPERALPSPGMRGDTPVGVPLLGVRCESLPGGTTLPGATSVGVISGLSRFAARLLSIRNVSVGTIACILAYWAFGRPLYSASPKLDGDDAMVQLEPPTGRRFWLVVDQILRKSWG